LYRHPPVSLLFVAVFFSSFFSEPSILFTLEGAASQTATAFCFGQVSRPSSKQTEEEEDRKAEAIGKEDQK